MVLFDRRTITVLTACERELVDITEQVQFATQDMSADVGMMMVRSLARSCAVINAQWQAAISRDLDRWLATVVPGRWEYVGDDPRYSDSAVDDSAAQLRAILLGRVVMLDIEAGEPRLGRYDSIILVELFGPKMREIDVCFFGSKSSQGQPAVRQEASEGTTELRRHRL